MNPQYLKEAKLCDSIKATTDINQAIQFSDVFLMALPTKAMREVAGEIDQHLSSKNIYSCRKGIENGTFKRVSEMLEDTIAPEHNAGIGVLSGQVMQKKS